jgi:hypothetical protein
MSHEYQAANEIAWVDGVDCEGDEVKLTITSIGSSHDEV